MSQLFRISVTRTLRAVPSSPAADMLSPVVTEDQILETLILNALQQQDGLDSIWPVEGVRLIGPDTVRAIRQRHHACPRHRHPRNEQSVPVNSMVSRARLSISFGRVYSQFTNDSLRSFLSTSACWPRNCRAAGAAPTPAPGINTLPAGRNRCRSRRKGLLMSVKSQPGTGMACSTVKSSFPQMRHSRVPYAGLYAWNPTLSSTVV
jgi:hypothetical protein